MNKELTAEQSDIAFVIGEVSAAYEPVPGYECLVCRFCGVSFGRAHTPKRYHNPGCAVLDSFRVVVIENPGPWFGGSL